jgi:hypothetical protein
LIRTFPVKVRKKIFDRALAVEHFRKALFPIKVGIRGKEKNFFSREKKFFPSPDPPSFFKKSGVFYV